MKSYQHRNSECRSPDAGDTGMWTSGATINACAERFLAFCRGEADLGNQDALLLMACFGDSNSTGPDQFARIAKSNALLEKVLSHSADKKYFVLLKIGDAQLDLVGELEKTEVPQFSKREQLLSSAAKSFESSLELKTNFAPTLDRLCTTQLLRGRLGEASKISEQLIRLVPNSAQAHDRRAEILRLLGSKLAAIEEQRAACDLNPYCKFLAIKLGDLYSDTGQHEKAIEAYRRGLEGDEARHAANMREAEEHNSADGEGEKELAQALIEWAEIERGGGGWQLHCSIARSLVALKRYHEAIESYQRALEWANRGAGQENVLMLQNELAMCHAAITRPK